MRFEHKNDCDFGYCELCGREEWLRGMLCNRCLKHGPPEEIDVIVREEDEYEYDHE